MQQRWPSRLWIVRHGESAGNVAAEAAHGASLARIDIAERDVDVALSARGERQADAVGLWFADQPPEARPEIVLTSPYRRARQTADRIRAAGGLVQDAPDHRVDERLRERELGILDRLTRRGVEQLHPEQAEMRRRLGKFYHRPPSGESWCDVTLRLRSALDTVSLHDGERRVLIVAHQVVVLCLRYLIEDMTEAEILAIDAAGDVANCSVTEYAFRPREGTTGRLGLERYNFVAPIAEAGAPITSEPDANVAAR
ncbi:MULTISPECIES: histidine phosphatase family protein [Methylobacterium]|jgi:probable phosphoglycerate mutase|uniref:Histidine phosphatase family protein n=1 Tax=Methylobacterium longum TaxID=767694 RepID=A0ABT8AJY9_9HYPH|nr:MULTISPECIES: histidine phosphatase family protein [Methylobacterium]MCJ2102013.1 histidine phosphatase family protein [Methylobacterium sp. E-046]MDN3570120.1 histidine phosphatase family protein [Methylobacterium longum]GJE12195.1 2,3-bisphosphoglycerate-dependent phosphoglycerate mutase [Methylobacterium longum]